MGRKSYEEIMEAMRVAIPALKESIKNERMVEEMKKMSGGNK